MPFASGTSLYLKGGHVVREGFEGGDEVAADISERREPVHVVVGPLCSREPEDGQREACADGGCLQGVEGEVEAPWRQRKTDASEGC